MAQIADLKKEIAELKAQNGDKWLTEQRASEIRSVVQDVLSDADTRASLQAAQATAGWNKGFFLASPDGNFKLNVGGQLQTRWAYNWMSNRDMNNSTGGGTSFSQAGVSKAAYGFEVRRAKLEFSGHVVDPSWQYAVTLAYQQFFGQNDSPASANFAGGGGVSQGDNFAGGIGLENAYIKKDLGNGFSVQVGQFKSPFLREWLVS
ncbi:MAG: porin, partial [Phycisphaerales bacterium]